MHTLINKIKESSSVQESGPCKTKTIHIICIYKFSN